MNARQERAINSNGGRAKGPIFIIGGGGDGGGCTRWKNSSVPLKVPRRAQEDIYQLSALLKRQVHIF